MRKFLLPILFALALLLMLITAGTAFASPWTSTGSCNTKGQAASGYLAQNTISLATNCFKDGTGPLG